MNGRNAPPDTARRPSWPFVGRDEELARAERIVRSRGARGLLLIGPAGVGKTRLARELLGRLGASQDVVRRVLATASSADIPLGALGPLLPSWTEQWTEPAPDGPDFVRWAVHAVTRDLGGRRLVLGVDDVHLLDPASATVVSQLAVTGGAVVVATARADVRIPDPVYALWKEHVVERLDIGPLDHAQVAQVVRTALDGQVDGAALHRMWTLTQGNALYLRELVTGARADGSLAPVGRVWQWSGAPDPTARLDEMLDERLRTLDATEREVTELLAFGEPLGADVLERLAGPDALDRLERAGLVVSDQLGRRLEVRLAHPLYSEMLRHRASALRSRAVHRRLAGALEGTQRARDHMRLITWRLAGALPVDPDELCTVAEPLVGTDTATAEHLCRAAVDAGGGYRAALLLGRVLLASGRADEAETVLAALDPDTPVARLGLAAMRAHNLFYALGSPARAAAVIGALDAEQEPGTADAAELVAMRAALLAYERRNHEAYMLLEPLLTDVEHGDGTTLQACMIAARSLCDAGRVETAAALAERGHGLAGRLSAGSATEWQAMHLDMSRVTGLAYAGRLTEAAALARERYDEAVRAGRASAKAIHAGFGGLVELRRGRVRSSTEWLAEATAGLRDGAVPLLPALRAGLVQSAALAGDLPTAAAVFDELRDAAPEYGMWVALARGWLLAVRGRSAEATTAMLESADHARDHDEVTHGILALHSVVRLGAPAAVVDRLADLAARSEGVYAPACHAHARALAAEDADALDALVDTFDAMGAAILAAEVAAQAAALHRRAGRGGSGAASANRARRMAAECEGARTPALALLDLNDDLTPREREVALLAARGMTSRAISESLTLSVRTVDNTLRSVYAKLHISGRHELAERHLG